MKSRSVLAGLAIVVATSAAAAPAHATAATAAPVRASAPTAARAPALPPGHRFAAPARTGPAPAWIHRSRHAFIASHWYDEEIGTDAFVTNKVEGGSWVGVGVGSLAAILGGGPPAWAAAAALTTFAGALQLCQKANGWTYSYFVKGVVVCNPF